MPDFRSQAAPSVATAPKQKPWVTCPSHRQSTVVPAMAPCRQRRAAAQMEGAPAVQEALPSRPLPASRRCHWQNPAAFPLPKQSHALAAGLQAELATMWLCPACLAAALVFASWSKLALGELCSVSAPPLRAHQPLAESVPSVPCQPHAALAQWVAELKVEVAEEPTNCWNASAPAALAKGRRKVRPAGPALAHPTSSFRQNVAERCLKLAASLWTVTSSSALGTLAQTRHQLAVGPSCCRGETAASGIVLLASVTVCEAGPCHQLSWAKTRSQVGAGDLG
mmetsp:Transcript_65239/g.152687  ORF Transcript_65239/g.152687 Transcript_65239/m.152687 type:complete len:281 (-) Transcript_65239:890-1732(-)